MLILLVMPIVLICLFGFAITTEVKNTRVCVVDGMCDENSQRIVTQVDATSYFDVVMHHHDVHDAERLMCSGKVDVVLVLDAELGVQVLAYGTEPNQAQMRAVYLQNILSRIDLN